MLFATNMKLAILIPRPLKESNLMKLLLACFSQTELYIYKDLCFHKPANYHFLMIFITLHRWKNI